MARGRAPGYDAQRERILVRAAELFARQGYTATSMNQVAWACGVSKPSLYHYVRDKHHLLAAIAQDHIDRLNVLVAEVRAEQLAPEALLRRLIERLLETYAGAQAAHRVLTEDVKFLEPQARERVLDGERAVVAAFADTITAVRPDLRAAQLDKPLTMLLFGMMNWMFTWFKPGALSYAAMAPVVADLFFGGLGAVRPATPPLPRPRARAKAQAPAARSARSLAG